MGNKKMNGIELNNFLEENYEKILDDFIVICKQHKVFGSFHRGYDNHNNLKDYGQIDFVCRAKKGKELFLFESSLGSDKWHGFKVLIYKAAYAIDNNLSNTQQNKVHVGIIMHEMTYSANLGIIMAYMGISYILLDNNGIITKKEIFRQ